ncbi:uncharacterized protein LOC123506541 [Portunus trituberculatus]|uniref:uncharacterized protein LOC123506541 n=1 Tax=Portunus trituberculatus TaxID=210409 RepID=UPI001E1CF763|nr:uncharacterized protein LOC123506541 [Portunus trituberculatus]
MAMEPSRGVAVVLLVAVCCLHGAHGRSPPRPPVCPLNNPLIKINFVQNAHGRAQVVQYVTDIPRLTSFTIHYWFSLETTSKTHTLFNYASDSYAGSELLEVQLETNDEGRNQFWKVTIEGVETRVKAYPPIGQWQWYHALHSWDSSTGIISHYINGELLQSHYNYQTKGLVISPERHSSIRTDPSCTLQQWCGPRRGFGRLAHTPPILWQTHRRPDLI